MSKSRSLSVEEAVELPAGDAENPSWVAGCKGLAGPIVQKQSKQGKAFWNVTILDAVNPGITIALSMFTAPKFASGDLIEITGSGLRRTEYNGKAQLSLSKSNVISLLQKGAVASANLPPQAASPASYSPAPASGASSEKRQIFGATVGSAVKLAVEMANASGLDHKDAAFWKEVHGHASQIIRIQLVLEAGNLAPRLGTHDLEPEAAPEPLAGLSGATAGASRPQPGPDGSAFPDTPDELGEDVPF
jgi:hypothetical protein